VRSVLPRLAIGPLRKIVEGELVHTATLTTPQRLRLPNGEYQALPPIVEPDVPCLLTSPTAEDAEIAAARGVEMKVRVLVALGTVVAIGTVATVEGEDADGNPWTRTVKVTATDFPDELVRVCAAVDTQLNQ
jgi:hypothetical protein